MHAIEIPQIFIPKRNPTEEAIARAFPWQIMDLPRLTAEAIAAELGDRVLHPIAPPPPDALGLGTSSTSSVTIGDTHITVSLAGTMDPLRPLTPDSVAGAVEEALRERDRRLRSALMAHGGTGEHRIVTKMGGL